MTLRRPGAARLRGVALSGAATLLCLAACSQGPVAIEPPDLVAADRDACRTLVADLPDSLGDRDRVEVSPADALGAAWGDPAIVMTCGGEAPELSPTAVCEEADGVGYLVEDEALADEQVDVTLVTAGYDPIITVVVPAEQRPEGVAAAMAGLAPAVEAHTALVRECL